MHPRSLEELLPLHDTDSKGGLKLRPAVGRYKVIGLRNVAYSPHVGRIEYLSTYLCSTIITDLAYS
jgi:hypothetical protein